MTKKGGKKGFFLKRWMTGLTNVFDRWLFKYTPEQGETYGKTFWWIVIVGFVGGIAEAIRNLSSKAEGIGTIAIIAMVVAGVLAIWYGFRNIKVMEGSVTTKIFRGLWILVWGAIGLCLGMIAGAFIVFAVIAFVVLYILLHMILNVDLSSGSSSRSSSNNNDDYDDGSVTLSNGTTIKQDSTGTWRNTNSWSDTYTQHGSDSFSQDN